MSAIKHDQEKAPIALIPHEAVLAEAQVWGFGAKKYGLHNFRGGFKTLRILSALMRHAYAIQSGEDIDPESGLPHAAHIRCCAGMLIVFQGRKDLDDRYKDSGGVILDSNDSAKASSS